MLIIKVSCITSICILLTDTSYISITFIVIDLRTSQELFSLKIARNLRTNQNDPKIMVLIIKCVLIRVINLVQPSRDTTCCGNRMYENEAEFVAWRVLMNSLLNQSNNGWVVKLHKVQ